MSRRTHVVSVGYEKSKRNSATMRVCGHTDFSGNEILASKMAEKPAQDEKRGRAVKKRLVLFLHLSTAAQKYQG